MAGTSYVRRWRIMIFRHVWIAKSTWMLHCSRSSQSGTRSPTFQPQLVSIVWSASHGDLSAPSRTGFSVGRAHVFDVDIPDSPYPV